MKIKSARAVIHVYHHTEFGSDILKTLGSKLRTQRLLLPSVFMDHLRTLDLEKELAHC